MAWVKGRSEGWWRKRDWCLFRHGGRAEGERAQGRHRAGDGTGGRGGGGGVYHEPDVRGPRHVLPPSARQGVARQSGELGF